MVTTELKRRDERCLNTRVKISPEAFSGQDYNFPIQLLSHVVMTTTQLVKVWLDFLLPVNPLDKGGGHVVVSKKKFSAQTTSTKWD